MKRQERDGSGGRPVRWKRRSVEEIGRILAGYQDSGLTQREYAQRAGVPTSNYYTNPTGWLNGLTNRLRLAPQNEFVIGRLPVLP